MVCKTRLETAVAGSLSYIMSIMLWQNIFILNTVYMTHLERVHLSDEQSKLAYVDQINQGNSHNDYGTQQYNTIKFNT